MRSLSSTPESSDSSRHSMTALGHPATLPLSHDLAEASTLTTSETQLATLARRQDAEVRAAVALHPATSPALLHQLAQDSHWVVLGALARNPRVTAPDLTILAQRAWDPTLPTISFVQHLATHVKTGLLQNRSTPRSLVQHQALHDADPEIRTMARAWLERDALSSLATGTV